MFKAASYEDYDPATKIHQFSIFDPCISKTEILLQSPPEMPPIDYKINPLMSPIFVLVLMMYYVDNKKSVVPNLAAYIKYMRNKFRLNIDPESLGQIIKNTDNVLGTYYYQLYFTPLKRYHLDRMLHY